ncbi:helix-turn-helix domain-containing protein [Nonomuraea soli]|uniref:AraC-like DNA-binding protein n=1 Tax=Nonomuraea soli TaxID=1032476 RepID=A0A7W0CLH1_9ACTN|nr:helix-turn-helix domain-containing protein [Nonomuraea soli]MBA2893391.1 AraC-like DNA-binding protein [Nonomuraea soli]
MYVEHAPPPSLAHRLVCVWEQVSEASGVHLVVPDGCVDVIWGPQGPHVAGPDTGPMPTAMVPGDRYFGIRFRPGAVGGALGLPIDELVDQRVPLRDLTAVSGGAASMRDLAAVSGPAPMRDLTAARGSASMRDRAAVRGVASVGDLADVPVADRLPGIAALIRDTAPPDPAAPSIAAALRAGRSVAEVAWDLGFSARQLHRRAVGAFGYSPKVLQRIVRFQRALRLARGGTPLALAAAESGYADQAHLANDVKRLAGVPMSHLLR